MEANPGSTAASAATEAREPTPPTEGVVDTPAQDTPTPEAAPVLVTGAHSSAALKVGDLPATPRARRGIGSELAAIFLPNRALSPVTMQLLVAGEAALALLFWVCSPIKVVPRPGEVFDALRHLWMVEGLGQDLMTSFVLNLQALGWSTLISLGLAYLTVIPLFRPIVAAISKGRFLSLVGFTVLFNIVFGGGRPLKVSLLVFGITVFYITSMAAVISAIPKSEFDYARTLRMSEWRVVWEVVVLGTVDKAFEVLRQNAAMGWMMLTMVEGIVRQEGGVGVQLLNGYKFMKLDWMFAIQLVILITGLIQDYAIGALRRMCCPYADLNVERK